jgi:hypothetical protein
MPSPNPDRRDPGAARPRAALCVIGNSIAFSYNRRSGSNRRGVRVLDVISGGRLSSRAFRGTPMDTNFCCGQIPR